MPFKSIQTHNTYRYLYIFMHLFIFHLDKRGLSIFHLRNEGPSKFGKGKVDV